MRVAENKERVIMHIDMDAFFACVEERSNPKLKDKPVIVCGDPRSRTVVASASYQAREFGIKAGMALKEARFLCPQAKLVIADHDKYIYTAERIFGILKGFTPCVEIFSIDEAFLDITDILHLYKGPEDLALKIKQSIKKDLGLSCSIGIGPNKLMAKFAGELKKPDGLFIVHKGQEKDILKNTPVEKLCGIGEKTKNRLLILGIRTCNDLADTPERVLSKEFGILGGVLKEMGRGNYSSPVCPYYKEPSTKSIGNSMTLRSDTYDKSRIGSTLLFLAEKTAKRLRSGGYQGKTVSLVVRLSDFSTSSKGFTMDGYSNDGIVIYRDALKLLSKFDITHKSVRMLGVSVSNLIRDQKQDFMFEYKKQAALNQALDKINDKFGEYAIQKAAIAGVN